MIVWTSSDHATSGFEHHWTANGVHGYDVTTPMFGGYTNDPIPPMPYGVFQVAVSHVDIDLDDLSGDPPPGPGQPDPKDEAEADTGVAMPITYNAPDLPQTFPLSDPTGRALSVNIISGQGGTLLFEGTSNQLQVYRNNGSAWEKVTAGIAVTGGSYSAGFRVQTSNQFTGPVMLKARLQHATSALDAADAVNVIYDGSPPGSPESYLNLAADSDNDNFDVQYRPPQYTEAEEDEEGDPGMQMFLGEGWAKIEVNVTDFDTGTLELTHDDAGGKFEFADAGFNVLSGSPLFSGMIEQTTFASPMVLYVRPKSGVAVDGDQVTLTANFTDSAGRVLVDALLVNAVGTIIDLDIFNGQYKAGANAVAEKYEQIPGAFTVANMNDTDWDGTADWDQPGVFGEKDLMRLILWRPKPYTAGTDVTLEFPTSLGNGDVKIYLDSEKVFEVPLVDKKATFTFTLDPSDFRKEVWVELTQPSFWVGDFEIKWKYNGKEAVVNATAIWATKTGFKNGLMDTLWTDAGNPLKNTFNTTYGGKFGIQYAGGTIQVQYAMGMEFTITPSAAAADWAKWRVVFDVTRQREVGSWKIVGATVTSLLTNYWPGRSAYSSSGPTGSSVDYANDDDPAPPGGAIPNSDNDNNPDNDHVYSIDGPGHPNDRAFDQRVIRANFLEFVRVRFDGKTPARTTGNEGTRCSPKAPWYIKIWSEKDGTAYKQRAGKGNAVTEGYSAILPAPTP